MGPDPRRARKNRCSTVSGRYRALTLPSVEKEFIVIFLKVRYCIRHSLQIPEN